MNLSDFFDYKNQIMGDMLTVPEIVGLITEQDQFGDDIYTVENAKELIYKQVFPFEYVPETVHDGSTFVCVDVDVESAPSKTFLVPVLYVWVFSHRSRLVLPNGGGVRTDALISEICKRINGSKEYGLGELDFDSCKRFAPMTDYNGKVLTFYAYEWNRQHNYSQYAPDNRKRI